MLAVEAGGGTAGLLGRGGARLFVDQSVGVLVVGASSFVVTMAIARVRGAAVGPPG